MSAYGAIARAVSSEPLPSTIWILLSKRSQGIFTPDSSSSPSENSHLTIHHLTLSTISQPGLSHLLGYLHHTFADEVDKGQTYPQETLPGEPMTTAAFEAYFFAADVFMGIIGNTDGAMEHKDLQSGNEIGMSVEQARAGRPWEDCVGGFYYVKPNYPGRSSHICNAGFVVPPAQRSKGFATALAKSYMHYAPKLGYQASVFNLVYANNVASLRIWENLGFEKVGRIPNAGRLKRKDGRGEEYVDAWVIYKSFVD